MHRALLPRDEEVPYPGSVLLGEFAAAIGPRPEMAELGQQHSGLKSVETTTPARDFVAVLRPAPMVPDSPHLLDHRLVASENHASVTQRPEVLPGIEAEAGGVAAMSDERGVPAGEVSVGTVLDHQKPPFLPMVDVGEGDHVPV